jgi:hypothetical protein
MNSREFVNKAHCLTLNVTERNPMPHVKNVTEKGGNIIRLIDSRRKYGVNHEREKAGNKGNGTTS